ncbi:MAG TPA: energy transducer TonB [Candidatus Polarisedimenticolia bacterium]|nr:energy transducer TonB [Candidatus Polarisedimenticolia bacterium]
MTLHRPARRLLAVLAASALAPLLAPAPDGASAATPDLKTYFASDFKDAAYQQKVHRKVGLAWKRPDPPAAGSKAVVVATILRDGNLLEARLHHKSGSDAWDASGVAAVKASGPFDPLPKSYPRTSVEVHFHFEYNN